MTVDANGLPVLPVLEQRDDDPGTRGRTLYVESDRLVTVLGTVTEFFDDQEWTRFLACTCHEYQESGGLICSHIAHVYINRLDIYEMPEDTIAGPPSSTGLPQQRVALPFEVGGGSYTPLVTIMGKEFKMAVRCGLFPLDMEGDRYVRACVHVPSQHEDTEGVWIEMGIAPREVGRGELRTMFVEWIVADMELNGDMACTAQWHEQVAREGYGVDKRRELAILDHWHLLARSVCYSCLSNDEIPAPYNPIEGVLARARRTRKPQSRSRANGGG